MYAKFFKRLFDFLIALSAILFLFAVPVFPILMIVGAIAMRGNPFFVQKRPGKKRKNGEERIFNLIKFRTMSNKKDKDGNLLPDDVRLNKYGKLLRSTSLDELPELFNILVGHMSIVGPRPLLVEYLPYYTEEERRRHDIRPGLTGWAQVNGRNNLDWDNRLAKDVEYVEKISLIFDVKILFLTVKKVLSHADVSENTNATEGNLADIRRKARESELIMNGEHK